jgi:hypothetical protein
MSTACQHCHPAARAETEPGSDADLAGAAGRGAAAAAAHRTYDYLVPPGLEVGPGRRRARAAGRGGNPRRVWDEPLDRRRPTTRRCRRSPAPVLEVRRCRCARPRPRGGFSATLLDGVTGSGKTEVYFEAIAARRCAAGRQALVLLPEIALSAQWLERFERRFGARRRCGTPNWLAQRRDTWRAVADGQAPVVVGARSALFLPFPDLGLIVVDEEHETAFKQEDGVIYHARDMAVVRAHLGGARSCWSRPRPRSRP